MRVCHLFHFSFSIHSSAAWRSIHFLEKAELPNQIIQTGTCVHSSYLLSAHKQQFASEENESHGAGNMSGFLTILSTTPWNTYEKWRDSTTHFWHQCKLEVSGQLHLPSPTSIYSLIHLTGPGWMWCLWNNSQHSHPYHNLGFISLFVATCFTEQHG